MEADRRDISRVLRYNTIVEGIESESLWESKKNGKKIGSGGSPLV